MRPAGRERIGTAIRTGMRRKGKARAVQVAVFAEWRMCVDERQARGLHFLFEFCGEGRTCQNLVDQRTGKDEVFRSVCGEFVHDGGAVFVGETAEIIAESQRDLKQWNLRSGLHCVLFRQGIP